MKILEESQLWYENAGKIMLEREFPAEVSCIAVGLAGSGSECWGFDDDISHDHDCQIGFALWITSADERRFGFKLERAYARLRKDFPPPPTGAASSMFGSVEQGVIVIEDFFRRHLGIAGAPQTFRQWLDIPEYALAETVNGKVFRDDLQIFSNIRREIRCGMPEDVRLKKLAARAAMMAQSGQYNFMRCIRHGEPGAAALFAAEFVRNAGSMVFLLNREFAPYCKWMLRKMKDLPKLNFIADMLNDLLGNTLHNHQKADLIEEIARQLVAELARQGLTESRENFLEPHALEITRRIQSQELRSMHIMEG